MSPYLLRSPGAFASFYWRYFAQTVVKNTTNHRHHRNEGIYINKLSMISLYSPFRMSIRLLTIMALQLALAHPRFLYLTLSKQLYIPGSRYSTVFIEHDLTTLEDSLLDIGIVFSLNQVRYPLLRALRPNQTPSLMCWSQLIAASLTVTAITTWPS